MFRHKNLLTSLSSGSKRICRNIFEMSAWTPILNRRNRIKMSKIWFCKGGPDFTRSKLFAALSVRSSSSNSHYFNVCVEYQPFLSTDTDLINLIRFLWFLFSHTVSTLYTGIKQDSSSRGLLGSSKKYTIVFVHVIPYVNMKECKCSNFNDAGSDYSSANGLPFCYKIEGRVYPNWKLKESEIDWHTSTRILVNFGQYIGLIRSDGTFVIHCVPSGSYVVEVANADVIFEPYRVEINARGKIRARKLNYVQPAIVYAVPYPLKFAANSTVRYFRPREQWRIADFLLNPMVLMMLMSLFIIVVFPKLNSVTDPEIQREMQQSMSMPSYDLPELSELMANWVVGKKKASRSKNLKLKRVFT
ncbi:ER membrane protein complex subunit 7 [Trichinella pseudospiralis]|uniref:ER membrane protein complex subunit 7 n=1 Tax=Trichinella pseudospiralis TaxID=6337 RepID=A0A0V1KAZ3_TRIPS|nr:ER membrane protein complex subunit 7 [Trichinella pseudospiralis]